MSIVVSLQPIDRRERRDEDRYRELIDRASDVVFTLDLKGNFTSVNAAGERLSGYTREEALALNLADVLVPEHLSVAQEMIRRKVMGEVERTRYPLAVMSKDGRRVELEVCTWLIVREGEQAEIQGIARDITEREQLLARERAARAEAEAALRARDQFLFSAAHELRTPLTTMLAHIEMLSEDAAERRTADEVRGLEVLQRQALRLRRLVEELVEVSRLDVGRLELCRRRLELGALAAQVLEEMRATPPRHQLVLEQEERVWVQADGFRIEQVLLNLVSNAIKYSPEGSQVTVSIGVRDGEALVTVRDEGIGIPAEQQRRLFERFYRVHADQPGSVRGMGLGLFISREFVERHGGRIWCESAEGEGSNLVFSLPLAD